MIPTERWRLNRAGIVNVYQYEQETIHFGGGRLLLRGVNGSGKSTAMNMLLPFLLDGDTRRIDAAGEQSGVLRSWMLSGREDPQPVGYLWLELERGEDHLCFGCGIKANRSTDNVSTWWWVTSRRPGLDLDLVDGAHPLSAEALRGTIAPDPLFRHEERARYREEIRRRLWGGAEIDQHIRLLHIVRNPRVGDRIDQDLPAHLHAALPELSERALLEAAQPLDDLEEHRNNVAELQRTSSALAALQSTYRDYARADLLRRTADARAVVADAERARRDASAATAASVEAQEAAAESERRGVALGHEGARLTTELAGLRDAPAYQEGKNLEDLRRLVGTLARMATSAEVQQQERTNAFRLAADGVSAQQRAAVGDHESLGRRLNDLAAGVVPAGLSIAAPDLPELVTVPLGDGDLRRPGLREVEGIGSRLEEMRGAVAHRRGDVAELSKQLGELDVAGSRLSAAATALQDAENDAARRRQAVTERRADLIRTLDAWRTAIGAWLDRLDGERRTRGLAPSARVDLGADLVDRRQQVGAALAEAADTIANHDRDQLARLEARRDHQQALVGEAEALVAELAALVLPDAPALPWQRADRGPVLAECVDFVPDVDVEVQAGVEAGLEASGLLGAEVSVGGLRLATGMLVARASATVDDGLHRFLTVAEDLDPSVPSAAVEGILASISIDPEHLEASIPSVSAVVTPSGRFRVGPLVGEHHKVEAEHIGLTARRATLERRRSEAADRLHRETGVLAAIDDEREAVRSAMAEVVNLRADLPSPQALDAAAISVTVAEQSADQAEAVFVERRDAHRTLEHAHAELVVRVTRTADSFGLRADRDALDDVLRLLSDVERWTHRVDDAATQLARTVQAWMSAVDRLEQATTDLATADDALAKARAEHEREVAQLATLEDAVGVEYREIVAAIEATEADHRRVLEEVDEARAEHLRLTGQVGQLAARADEMARATEAADRRSVASLAAIRRALAVPGLLDAAASGSEHIGLTVEASTAGLRNLVRSISSSVPPPERLEVTADGVRQSLRQRRDSLGAGWDAEDQQRDESLPLSIEVNGPTGRFPLVEAATIAERQLAELTSLLSAEQDHALRNLLQGLVAHEVAEKLHAAGELVERMNRRLDTITTTHGIGVSLRWRRRDGLDDALAPMVEMLALPPELRTPEQTDQLRVALAARLDRARQDDPDSPYRDLVAGVLDYRDWYDITLLLRRPGHNPEKLTKRTPLSEGEKKIVSYLPLFAAVAASCDSLGETAADAPRFLLLDDAFAKVSEDNHAKLFGLLVELDLDFIATSERLWGTHASVPELAITEVLRDASLGAIVLEHSRWNGATRTVVP